MAVLLQPCTGPNGSAVSTANATFATQWDAAPSPTGAGTTHTYDNAQTVHGYPTSQKIHYSTAASTAYCAWKAAYGGTAANAFGRSYFYMPVRPTVATRFMSLLRGLNGLACAIQIGSAGSVIIVNAAGTNVGTMTGKPPVGAWFRMELDCTNNNGTTGDITARIYSGANLETTTPDTTGTVTSTGATVTGLVNEYRIGSFSNVTETVSLDVWFQDAGFCDTAVIPPVGVVRPTLQQTFAIQRAANY